MRDVIEHLTKNPLKDKLDAILATAYTCRDRFAGSDNKQQALIDWQKDILAVYEEAVSLKNGLPDGDARLSSIDGVVDTLESISREVFAQAGYTYIPLPQLQLYVSAA